MAYTVVFGIIFTIRIIFSSEYITWEKMDNINGNKTIYVR